MRRREKAVRCLPCASSFDVPFEFVGEIARTSAVAKPGHIERSSSTTRHAKSVDAFVQICI